MTVPAVESDQDGLVAIVDEDGDPLGAQFVVVGDYALVGLVDGADQFHRTRGQRPIAVATEHGNVRRAPGLVAVPEHPDRPDHPDHPEDEGHRPDRPGPRCRTGHRPRPALGRPGTVDRTPSGLDRRRHLVGAERTSLGGGGPRRSVVQLDPVDDETHERRCYESGGTPCVADLEAT